MSGATAATRASTLPKDLGVPTERPAATEANPSGLSMVVFSGDLDKVLAAMIIANGAATMDLPVNIFFTFWGLNVLRKGGPVQVQGKKTTTERMFGGMMPRGPDHLQLSKMKMAGLGTRMIKKEMAKKHVMSLPNLMKSAQEQGVRFIACTMSMDLMGIHKEELIPGIEYANVGTFIDAADRSRMTMFI
ncbi:MAG: DsrE/DsrF/DrsH-like family protein [Thermoplasmata archaeon]